jgi:ferredoxin
MDDADDTLPEEAAEKKPPSIALFYFSGTGNTELVAGILAKELRDRGATVDLVKIEDVTRGTVKLDTYDYDMIGIGHVVHAFNAPRIVYDFVKKLPFARNKPAFVFRCACDLHANGGSTLILRDRLWQRGYRVFHESVFVTAANVVIPYSDELTKQLFNAAAVRAKRIAKEIVLVQNVLQRNTLTQRLWTSLSYLESLGARMLKLHFRVSKECALCEECIRNCPTANICRSGDGISFRWRCIMCMRCVYGCPKRAISLWLLNWVPLKGRYDVKSIVENPSLKGEYLTPETKGYYRRMYNYIADSDSVF